MKAIVKEMAESLGKDGGSRNSQRWVNYIVENDIPLKELLPVLEMERKMRTRFSWMMGGLVERDPGRVFKEAAYIFRRRNDFDILNFDRSVAKILWQAGVPEEIEGEAMDQLFEWLQDPKINVSTKVYAMDALYGMLKKYPELENELRVVIEDQYGKCSVAFQSRANRVLKRMLKIKFDTKKGFTTDLH